jgi:hypothetical protein
MYTCSFFGRFSSAGYGLRAGYELNQFFPAKMYPNSNISAQRMLSLSLCFNAVDELKFAKDLVSSRTRKKLLVIYGI